MTGDPDDADSRILQWARRSAADYVSKHSTSRANLEKIIARRASRRYPDLASEKAAEIARKTADFFVEHLFVDDAAYAEARVRSGVRKGHSRRRIAAGLVETGVAAETAAEALSGADDMAAALAFARRRRIGPWRRGEDNRETRDREGAALARSGFSYEISRRIVSMSLDEAEEAASSS